MKFSHVASIFDAISKVSSRTEITTMLASLLSHASAHEACIIANFSLGQLRASYKGNKFNFAEKSMLKMLTSLLDGQDIDTKASMQTAGDVGIFIQQSAWPFTDAGITVIQLYEQLVAFEEISGSGSVEDKSTALKKILMQLDAISASFVARIVVGTLRLGFSDMTLVDSISWMLVGDKTYRAICEDAYNVCADVGYIVTIAKEEGVEGLKKVVPVIGVPIRPAAAERSESAKAIFERLGICVAQPKLDGFRLQIHIEKIHGKTHTWFFSRNLLDMSSMFPDLVRQFEQLDVKTLIIEGEAIVFDEDSGSYVPFQETVKRKRKHDIEEVAKDLPLRFFIFDILYLNGESVLSFTHEERRALMKKVFASYPEDSAIKVINEVKITSPKELEDYFNSQISEGLEGIVVKRIDSIYRPGKRNFNWIKLKRQEEGHLDDTIDAVVLGYYYGKGKRTGFGIGAFLVGLYNKAKDRFETVAKIGTGLRDADWIELKKRCDAIAVTDKPHNVVCSPELAPDIWTSPEIVIIARADEITRSPLHSVDKTEKQNGLALRFPRFLGYAVDKQATQATTDEELKELFELQFKKTK